MSYDVLLTQSESCVYQWKRNTTLFRKNIKAQEYVTRLETLDNALNDTKRRQIFQVLKFQIAMHIGEDRLPVNRDVVKGLTAAQCKAILQALHNGLGKTGLNRELNRAKFEAVNFYSSERAKGKVCALYEYLMIKNADSDALPVAQPTELQEFPRHHGRAVERELRLVAPIASIPPIGRRSDSVASLTLNTVRAAGLTGLRPQRVSEVDENGYLGGLDLACVSFLNEGVAENYWSSQRARTFSRQDKLAEVITKLKRFCDSDTIQNISSWSPTILAREVSQLVGGGTYSNELNEMAKTYLRKKIVRSEEIDKVYRTSIASLLGMDEAAISDFGLSYGDRARRSTGLLDPYANIDSEPVIVPLGPSMSPETQPEAPSVLDYFFQKAKTLVKRKTPDTAPDAGPARAPLSLFEQPETGSRSPALPSTDKLKTAAVEAGGKIAMAASAATTKLQEGAGRARAALGTTGAATRAIFSRMGSTPKSIKWTGKIKSAFSKTDKPDTYES